MHWHSKAFHHRMAFPLDTTGFNGVHGGWAWLIELGILKAFFFSFQHGFFLFKPLGFSWLWGLFRGVEQRTRSTEDI